MKYLMKSGILYQEPSNKMLAKINKSYLGPERTITLSQDKKSLETTIQNQDAPAEKRGDVRYRKYVLWDHSDKILVEAHPNYSPAEDPDQKGWPIYRMPKVDHATICIKNNEMLCDQVKDATKGQEDEAFNLRMVNSQDYRLEDASGRPVFEMQHKGITGGWTIASEKEFSPQIICALFIFCRYIEQENEFPIV